MSTLCRSAKQPFNCKLMGEGTAATYRITSGEFIHCISYIRLLLSAIETIPLYNGEVSTLDQELIVQNHFR